MKNYADNRRALIKTQYWLFKKQKGNILLLIVFLLAGLYGLYQGFAFKNKQVRTIASFREEKINSLNELKRGLLADTTMPEGKAAFKKATGTISSNWNIVLPAGKVPVSTAIFAIGQADVFPYYYTIKNESFFMQLFKQGEIANPLRSLSGHFDTGFWIIYLLPLLIITLCFNTLSAETDNGNWKLISSQGIHARQWLSSKFLLVGLIMEIMLLCIFITGLLLNFFSFNQAPVVSDILFLIAANIYLLFWLSLIYAINAYGKNSINTALYSGIAWITICFIIPAMVTTVIEKSIPVDNTIISRMSRRPQGSKFNDTGFGMQTIRQLGNVQTQYKNATLRPGDPSFTFGIYLAYHTLMDDTSTIAVQHYFKNIELRQQLTNTSCLFNPAAGTDGFFASMAANDAAANHAFTWQAKALHQQLHNVYFPPVFFNRRLTKDDYDKMPVFAYHPVSVQAKNILNYVPLLLLSVLVFIMSNRKLKKR